MRWETEAGAALRSRGYLTREGDHVEMGPQVSRARLPTGSRPEAVRTMPAPTPDERKLSVRALPRPGRGPEP